MLSLLDNLLLRRRAIVRRPVPRRLRHRRPVNFVVNLLYRILQEAVAQSSCLI